MTRSITKVKNNAIGRQEISVENVPSWQATLVDICDEIERLQKLVPIVKRKIERGEPWPGTQSQGHDSDRQHSV
jgi:hypothetical protein